MIASPISSSMLRNQKLFSSIIVQKEPWMLWMRWQRNSTVRKTNRWPLVIFYSILNVAAINARIVLLSNKNPAVVYQNRCRFIKDLSFSLIRDHANKRMDNSSLAHELRAEIEKTVAKSLKNHQKRNQKLCQRVGVSFVPQIRT